MYVKVKGGTAVKYTLGRLRSENPNVSFPFVLEDSLLAEYGVYRLEPTDPPAYDPITHRLVETDPVEVDGQWQQAWAVEEYTEEEIAAQQRQRDIAETTSPEALTDALEVLSRKVLGLQDLDAMEDRDLEKVGRLFAAWSIKGEYATDDVCKYKGVLYRCLQAHAAQWNSEPDSAPSLWTPVRQPLAAWVQPLGAQDAYDTGARVTHDNPNDGGTIWIYESTIDANTNEPGRDGTFDRWWAPIEPT